MKLTIIKDSNIPVYLQIKNQIIKAVATGELERGEELPSVRTLANDLGINHMTVAKTYKELNEEGILNSQKSGTTVSLELEEDEELRNSYIDEFKLSISKLLVYGFCDEDIESLLFDFLRRSI